MKIECEKTKAGWQYVILGTELVKPKLNKSISFNTELINGKPQFVISGAEQESLKSVLERKTHMPMRGKRIQKNIHSSPLFRIHT